MFTYDLGTDIGKLRRIINDQKEDSYIYEDDELEFFMSFFSTEDNLQVKLIKTAIMIVTNLSQKYSESIGTRVKIHRIEKEITADKAKAMKDLLNSLNNLLKMIEKKSVSPMVFGGGIHISNKPSYEDILSDLVAPNFQDNQFDFSEGNINDCKDE